MNVHRTALCRVAIAAGLIVLSLPQSALALPAGSGEATAIELAQAPEITPHELQPRYEPVPPPQKSWYNSSYLFGMTRGVASSTLVPGAKAPLFLLTVPLDIVLLPFTAIAGCFG